MISRMVLISYRGQPPRLASSLPLEYERHAATQGFREPATRIPDCKRRQSGQATLSFSIIHEDVANCQVDRSYFAQRRDVSRRKPVTTESASTQSGRASASTAAPGR